MNEIKSQVDEFDSYVEDIFNRLAINTGMSTEAETEEESSNRDYRNATEPSNPGDHLTTESLTPIQSSSNLLNIERQQQQQQQQPSTPSNLSIVQINDIISNSTNDISLPVTNTININTTNTNTKKETYNKDEIVKKINDNKKEKVSGLKKLSIYF